MVAAFAALWYCMRCPLDTVLPLDALVAGALGCCPGQEGTSSGQLLWLEMDGMAVASAV